MWIAIIFLGLAVIFTALGQLLYKLYFTHKMRYFLTLAIFCFLLVPLFNYRALTELTIDIVYLSTSIKVALVLLFSYIFLNEHVSKQQIWSSLFIIVGIILYNL
ncbi:MAG: EamA family transporter [Thermotogota bacterium]